MRPSVATAAEMYGRHAAEEEEEKEEQPPWVVALPWLWEYNQLTTRRQVAELIAYFRENPEQFANNKKIKRTDPESRHSDPLCMHNHRSLPFWTLSPLFYAAWRQRGEYGLAVVKALLEMYPAAADADTARVAAVFQRGRYGVLIVEALLKACPDVDVSVLLRAAIAHQQNEWAGTMVAMLLRAKPEAAREFAKVLTKAEGEAGYGFGFGYNFNHSGYLPLHIAADNQTGQHTAGVFQALLDVYPEAAQRRTTPTGRGCHLPKELARKARNIPAACMQMLVTAEDGMWPRQQQDDVEAGP